MNEISGQSLRRWIGKEVTYGNGRCQIIEILDDGPAVVLCCQDAPPEIQGNQFGEPSRRVPKTLTIPVYAEAGVLSERFLILRSLLGEE